MTTVLTVRGAAKRYGQNQALAGAGTDLDLAQGEFVALLGPNGAGKTTLIRAIAGRVRLSAGEISLLGRALSPGTAGREELGVVPQDIALYPLLSATENLRVFGALAGVHAAGLDEAVAWGLAFTGLAERAREPIRGFSGGMKRRLNIACSVLHKPRVILLDEPTVGVDPQSRQRIWEMLGELRAAGASMLLTTHQLDEAQALCDRIVIIDGGRVIEAGSLGDLVGRTVGQARRVTITVGAVPVTEPEGTAPFPREEALAALCNGVMESVAGREVRCRMIDVGGQLPGVLASLAGAGLRIEDVQVTAPTLHEVFLHLTGRELRE